MVDIDISTGRGYGHTDYHPLVLRSWGYKVRETTSVVVRGLDWVLNRVVNGFRYYYTRPQDIRGVPQGLYPPLPHSCQLRVDVDRSSTFTTLPSPDYTF